MSPDNKLCNKCKSFYISVKQPDDCPYCQLASVQAELEETKKYLHMATQANAGFSSLNGMLTKQRDESRQEVERLKAEAQKERIEADKACVRAGDRWKQYDAERQDHNITKRELAALQQASDKYRMALDVIKNMAEVDLDVAPQIAHEALEQPKQ